MIEQWNKVCTPPKDALKKITGGRLSGMTDIKPQWRIQVMTETYGLCGVGWRYDILRKETFTGSDGQIVAVVDINLYVKVDDRWSYAIPGTGGSMLVEKEKAGLHTNDECFKMALTDALSVAMKSIGVASDIYMGLWDGSKYGKKAPETPQDAPQAPEPDVPDLTAQQIVGALKKKLGSQMKLSGISTAEEQKKFYQYCTDGLTESVDVVQNIIDRYDEYLEKYKEMA